MTIYVEPSRVYSIKRRDNGSPYPRQLSLEVVQIVSNSEANSAADSRDCRAAASDYRVSFRSTFDCESPNAVDSPRRGCAAMGCWPSMTAAGDDADDEAEPAMTFSAELGGNSHRSTIHRMTRRLT